MSDARRNAGAAAILAVAMVLSAVFVSKLFVRIRHEKTITVKGYAEQAVASDIGTFRCAFKTRRPGLPEAYEDLRRIREIVLGYVKEKGFPDDAIELMTIDVSPIYKRDAKGNRTNEVEYHAVRQEMRVTSGNVGRIDAVSRSITELIREGIDIDSGRPAFYVSDLDAVKVSLIAEATRNGYERAKILAENSGGAVGSLTSARQGVFQITSPNSTETSGYGMYDTSTIEKSVKAVVTLEYAID